MWRRRYYCVTLPWPLVCLQVETGLAALDWPTAALYLLVVGLCAPLWEEAVFRGFLLPSLCRSLPPAGAVLASGALFAACHFRPEMLAPLLLLGVVFGALYLATRNLLPSVVAHGLWNVHVLGTLVLRLHFGVDAATASLMAAASTQAALAVAALIAASVRAAARVSAAATEEGPGGRGGSGASAGSA
jgi:Type II CAAX prenyl endopeptidase Rce1-like